MSKIEKLKECHCVTSRCEHRKINEIIDHLNHDTRTNLKWTISPSMGVNGNVLPGMNPPSNTQKETWPCSKGHRHPLENINCEECQVKCGINQKIDQQKEIKLEDGSYLQTKCGCTMLNQYQCSQSTSVCSCPCHLENISTTRPDNGSYLQEKNWQREAYGGPECCVDSGQELNTGLCQCKCHTKQPESWKKEFGEEFCKGGEWIAPNMKGSYIKVFIRKALANQRKDITEKIEGMKKLPDELYGIGIVGTTYNLVLQDIISTLKEDK